MALLGVSMPGHFLLRSGEVYVDPFSGGSLLDRDGVAARFRQLHGDDAPWDDTFLAPVGPHAIVARLLANLKAIFGAQRDRANLLWVLQLRSAVPGVSLDERREVASVLAADGKFDQAARELESAASLAPEVQAAEFRAAAVRLQARLN